MVQPNNSSDISPLNMSDAEKKAFLKTLTNAISNLKFLRELAVLPEGLNTKDVQTHIGLMEYHLQDLTAQTHYDSVLAKEAEKRNLEIRKANRKIKELTMALGKELHPDALTGALRRYDDIISAVSEAIGFHYCSTSITPFGLRAEFSNELEFIENTDGNLTGDSFMDDLFRKCRRRYGTLFDKNLDIIDEGHSELYIEDTTKNKQLLTDLLTQIMPHIQIDGFSSRRNHDRMIMRTQAFIPFTDIQRISEWDDTPSHDS